MTNCKVGDLAIIVHARHPENIGKIVEVVRVGVKGDRSPAVGMRGGVVFRGSKWADGTTWWVRSKGSPLYAGDDRKIPVMERVFNDRYLRPIPKLDEPTNVTTNEDLGVPA
jgi:hypothetical protein